MLDAPGLVEEDYRRAAVGKSFENWEPLPNGAVDFINKLAAGPSNPYYNSEDARAKSSIHQLVRMNRSYYSLIFRFFDRILLLAVLLGRRGQYVVELVQAFRTS